MTADPVDSKASVGINLFSLEAKDVSSWVQFDKMSSSFTVPFEILDFISSESREGEVDLSFDRLNLAGFHFSFFINFGFVHPWFFIIIVVVISDQNIFCS